MVVRVCPHGRPCVGNYLKESVSVVGHPCVGNYLEESITMVVRV